MSSEDALAVSMLVILGIAGTTLLTILYSLVKNAGKKDELEELLAENEPAFEDLEEPAKGKDKPRQPWEKDGDWWKL